MPLSELDDDDEDWYDDESDAPDDEWVPCPECGESVPVIAGKCPACGYWLTEADQRASSGTDGKPVWIKLTAVVVLVALLAGMFGIVVGVF
jgi:hypothetical protein